MFVGGGFGTTLRCCCFAALDIDQKSHNGATKSKDKGSRDRLRVEDQVANHSKTSLEDIENGMSQWICFGQDQKAKDIVTKISDGAVGHGLHAVVMDAVTATAAATTRRQKSVSVVVVAPHWQQQNVESQ